MYAHDIDNPFYRGPGTLRLVKPNPAQASTTIQWLGRPEVTQYLGADFSTMTLADEEEHLRNMLTNDNAYSWMIELDNQIVGDSKNWGQGLGTCAKQAATTWAFEEGDFALLEGKAYVQNERSWRALEKLGFAYQGLEEGKVEGQPVTWKVYTLKNP